MANKGLANFQIGKQGLNGKFLDMLAKSFNTREFVKISVLPSCTRNKQEIKEIAETIKSYLGGKLKKEIVIRIVGFTIIIKKHRRALK